MILNIVTKIFNNPLLFKNHNTIVLGYKKRRSVFDFTGQNSEWVPKVKPYSKNRKPPQSGWADPQFQYPKLIPAMRKTSRPQQYLNTIQQEQKIKIQRQRNFLLPNIRSGDIVQISYQETFQNENIIKYKAFVLGLTKKHSLMAGLKVAIRLAGVNVQAHYIINSPKIKNIEILARGSGNFKSNLSYFWEKDVFSKSFISTPLRNSSMKKRGGESRLNAYAKSGSLKLDKIEDDSSKRQYK